MDDGFEESLRQKRWREEIAMERMERERERELEMERRCELERLDEV